MTTKSMQTTHNSAPDLRRYAWIRTKTCIVIRSAPQRVSIARAAVVILYGAILAVVSGCVTNREAASRVGEFEFIQLCDPQFGMSGYVEDMGRFRQAVKQINSLSPDFVVVCGDLVNRPGTKDFSDFMAERAGLDVSSYCVPGNHDINNVPTLESIERYRKSIGKDYYSVEHKGYLFLFVNSQLWKTKIEGESEKQDEWLENSLRSAAGKKMPVFIIGHHPLYVVSPDEKGHWGTDP